MEQTFPCHFGQLFCLVCFYFGSHQHLLLNETFYFHLIDCSRSDRIWLEYTTLITNESRHKTERFSHSASSSICCPRPLTKSFWILNVPWNDWYNRGRKSNQFLLFEWMCTVHSIFDIYRFWNQGNNLLRNCHVLESHSKIDIFDIWCYQIVVINYTQFKWERIAKVLSPAYTTIKHQPLHA